MFFLFFPIKHVGSYVGLYQHVLSLLLAFRTTTACVSQCCISHCSGANSSSFNVFLVRWPIARLTPWCIVEYGRGHGRFSGSGQ